MLGSLTKFGQPRACRPPLRSAGVVGLVLGRVLLWGNRAFGERLYDRSDVGRYSGMETSRVMSGTEYGGIGIGRQQLLIITW